MKKQIHHILAKTPLLIRVVSLYVVIGSFAGLYLYLAQPVQAFPKAVVTPVAVRPVEQTPVEPKEISGLPRHIELPRIGLSLDVIDGQYDAATQQWTLTDDKAQFADMTNPINNISGQTMIYGHNSPAVLEPVKDVAVGDELLVTTDTGRVLVYTYSSDRFVYPTDTSVFDEAPATPRVVLMTCEGWLSLTRRLLYFDFKEVR